MGTGIVATAAATLPLRLPGLHGFATAVWILAGTVLVVLTGAFATHWIRYREQAKAYAAHQVVGQFYGAPAMALLTVGAGALLFGPDHRPVRGAGPGRGAVDRRYGTGTGCRPVASVRDDHP